MSRPLLTDTHCHLDFEDFNEDREQVLQRALDTGVHRIISIGTNLETSARAVALAEAHPQVYATVGIHPNEVAAANEGDVGWLRRWADHPKVVALGEAGLDYHYLPGRQQGRENDPEDLARIERQKMFFREQLKLADELGWNIVVHQRSAWEDTLELLREAPSSTQAVLHCFGENASRANEVIEMGHLVSFTGLVTFKNADVPREGLSQVQLGKFMVETDAPYMAPVPHRGSRCEPAFTANTAARIAEHLGISLDDLSAATESAADSFFKLPTAK